VTADLMLADMAELEARHAVEDMFGLDPPSIKYEAQSAILFLRPEVATVGFGEQTARERGIRYRAATISNGAIRRSLAMRAVDGFVKLLARPDGRVLGLRVVGPQASSAIQGIAFLIDNKARSTISTTPCTRTRRSPRACRRRRDCCSAVACTRRPRSPSW
jgi:dihydrolipoamide dehydrogenase